MPRTGVRTGRLVWTRTRDGWTGGRYRIDLIAPEMWALVVDRWAGQSSRDLPHLVSTSASLNSLRHEAQRREWRRWRMRRLIRNSLGAVIALGGFALLSVLPPVWTVAAGISATILLMRSVSVMANIVTQTSWTQVSQTYQ